MPLIQEATVGLEPTMGVLQTPALPLGYVAGKAVSLQLSVISAAPRDT